jgi:cytochrome c oxidase subunit 2
MHFALIIEALGICPNAAQHGFAIDSMLEMLHWFMAVLFIGWGSFYAYLLWRFHASRHPKADYTGATSHLPTKLEGGILILEVVILLAFAAPLWANRTDQFPVGPNVIHLRAVGEQFLWNFEYTGADGQFGHHDVKLVSASNPLGIDRNDPAAYDNLITRGELHLPVDQPCIVDVESKDVIHDFCIPNMRIAQDAIPGSIIPMYFTPVKEGTYEVVCAQLCGTNHSAMRATLVVESMEKYKKWFRDTAKLSGAKVVDGRPVAPVSGVAVAEQR